MTPFRVAVGLALALWLAFAQWLPVAADVPRMQPPAPGALRVATLNADLTRRGPGLLLRDILGRDAQVTAIARIIAHVGPDVLLITKFDHDHDLIALEAFDKLLEEAGHAFGHRFALRPNSGAYTGLDMTGDGRRNTPDDAQGYGSFAGSAGMALLSRHPVRHDKVRDFSAFRWRDLPDTLFPRPEGRPFPSEEVMDLQRLSSTGHWDVPLELPDGRLLHVLAFHASPPVFGGPHQRNLLRNHDEVRFWSLFLSGELPMPPPAAPLVLVGDANLDPLDGDGMHAAMVALLEHPRLQDPQPSSRGGVEAARNPLNATHLGDPALDTVEWLRPEGPGNLRVDYVLPDRALDVTDAGVFWPAQIAPERALLGEGDAQPTRHRMVWVDVRPQVAPRASP